MNKHYRLLILALGFFLSFSLPRLSAEEELLLPDPGAAISMDFKDANLKDILKAFSIQSGMNFIASQGVQDRTLTLYLDNVPVSEAMDKIFKANNLSYEFDKKANIIIVKDWGVPGVETITKVFYLKYATVSTASLEKEKTSYLKAEESTGDSESTSSSSSSEEGGEAGITGAIKKMLSVNGSIIEDFRTNSLIITDVPSRMSVIAQTIAALDVAVPQIMLEVEMLDVNKNATEQLGLKFGQTPFTATLTGDTVNMGFPFQSWGKMFTTDTDVGTLSVNGTDTTTYTVALDFLKTQSDTKFLARPRLLTLNNQSAEIKISTQESIGVTTTTEASTSTTSAEPERSETGVSLRVTPQANVETGEITMFIYPKVAEASQGNTLTSNGQSYRYRDPEERSTKSVVRIKDGETVIIGGLIRNKKSETFTKLPFFGDIPLLGKLFTHRSTDENRERELLVFITPHIIKDTNLGMIQPKRIALPEREQSLISGASRQGVINTNLNVFDKKK